MASQIKISGGLVFLALVFSGRVWAEEITMACTDHYRPYSYQVNNEPRGIYAHILGELFQRMGYEHRIKILPFKRVLCMTRSGQVTGMAGAFFTPKRDEYALFICNVPLARISQSLFILNANPIDKAKAVNFQGGLIGHKRGFLIPGEFIVAAEKKMIRTIDAERTDQLIDMLIRGRLDGFIHNTFHVLAHIENHGRQTKIKHLPLFSARDRPAFIAFSRKALKTLPESFPVQVQNTLGAMHKEGFIQALQPRCNPPTIESRKEKSK
ncbi:MAG: transporter substrate-binding domain-containing protein [Desulfobacter sp.]|nr:transporter substrate-binding domain-containing protein [Desulfobacter sp.]